MDDKIVEFLRESNAIECEYDDDSLRQAMFAWEHMVEQDSLDRRNILKTHKILMLHQPLLPTEKGYIRTVDVRVGPRICPAPRKLRHLLDIWVEGANELPKTEEQIIADHVAFEHVHCFVDGNGRMGRILLNWQRIKSGLPILVIKESERQEYYKLFR